MIISRVGLSQYIYHVIHITSEFRKKYVNTFDYIECIISSIECDYVIICGDYNTSFEKESGQDDYLNDFISRSNMKISWDNDKAMKDIIQIIHLVISLVLITLL